MLQPTQGVALTISAKDALKASVAAVAGGNKDLADLSRGKAGTLRRHPLQRMASFIDRYDVNSLPVFGIGTGIGFLGGLVAGFVAGLATNSGWTFLEVWGGVTAAGAAIAPLAGGTVMGAEIHDRIVSRRMVELSDLRTPLERFRTAEGIRKAQVGFELVKLRNSLDAQRVLSPEAGTALEDVVAEVSSLPQEQRVAAERLGKVATALEHINDKAVDVMSTELAAAPSLERKELAMAVRELVFSDRKRVGRLDYDVRNRLHAVLRDAEQSETENS